MRTKVAVDELKCGMYVSALDRPWRETPFLFQGLEITDDAQLAELRQHCQYVYIDDAYESGAGTGAPKPSSGRAPEAGPAEAKRKPRLHIIAEKGSAVRSRRVRADRTHVEQEAKIIRETHDEGAVLIHTIMGDVHLGKSIDTGRAKKVVGAMAKSVLRNPDALVCFAQLKKRDDYTALHCLRVCILALAFGRHLGLEEEELNFLGMGALLHDVGKMRVPDAILNKPYKLNEREYEIMKSHVPMGMKILERTRAIPAKALEVVSQHHERYAGHGYMDKLQGNQISEFGLISAIVDVYDAMTSDRVYKDGISSLDALKKMYDWRQRDFHPGLLEQFIQCIGIFPIGSVVVLNTDEVGVVRTLNRQQRLKPQVALITKPDKTRYPVLRVVDLARETAPKGEPYGITKVVPPAMFNIEPVDYLPVKAVA
jgi:putative nucleotidyltransferase with HDIG domain